MKWRTKSLVISAVEKMPFSEKIYYLLQRFVTHSIPRSRESIEKVIDHEERHLSSYRKYTGADSPAEVFEFGAGWDLCSALVRHQLGVPRQHMIDLNRLATAWQINHVIAYLASRTDSESASLLANLEALELLGISYLAPADASKTGFCDEQIDLIASTNTLEHIPPPEIQAILTECRRILRSDGIMSMKVDYSDHYSHADSSIGPYNFLQFSDDEWEPHNHAHHYQSRLRHSDYISLFERAGFTILHEEASTPEGPTNLPNLADKFRTYETADLLPTEGYFVLAKRA